MISVSLSLEQLLGKEYIVAVKQASVFLNGLSCEEADLLSSQSIDFFPQSYIDKLNMMLELVGRQVVPELKGKYCGAPTDAFGKASNIKASPIGGLGYYRLGEDGRLYLAAKSEHYHAPLGHGFPGFKLLENAARLGITNATHNNTRGYITRLLEAELVRTANGIDTNDNTQLSKVIASQEPHVLNRVINLETGSLAVEAGVKMMLARFYKLEKTHNDPEYKGKIPVFLVIGDNDGGRKANYHGTTVITQVMRDLWPELYQKLEDTGVIKVVPVEINDFEDFKYKFMKYNNSEYKIAGFLHEIVLMNYGGIRLTEEFLNECYDLCHNYDTPVLCDEIQSCMWYPGMYLFKMYKLNPDFVVIGKGFPGGQYAASRIITTYEMDNLNQFGALVTNGQEELASLSYLITMAFAEVNSDFISDMGLYYEKSLRKTAELFPEAIERVEGKGHLSTMFFYNVEQAVSFAAKMNEKCIDVSAQTYKAKCPPAVLTKPPIISDKNMIDYLINQMNLVLSEICSK